MVTVGLVPQVNQDHLVLMEQRVKVVILAFLASLGCVTHQCVTVA